MTKTTEQKPIRIFKDSGYLVNVKNLTESQIKRMTEKFTYSFYDEKACQRCDFLQDRHGENCDSCPSYQGTRQLAKVVERGDQYLLSMPYGATERVRALMDKLGRPWKAVSRHPSDVPFKRRIRFKAQLRPYQVEAKDAIKTKKKGVIKAPPRSGKCVEGSTMILTNSGLCRIDSLFKNRNLGATGETYLSPNQGLSVLTSEGFKPVDALYSKVVDSTVRIATSQGKKLRGTPNHPVQVVDANGQLKWVSLEDLNVGDFLVTTADKSAWGNGSVALLSTFDAVRDRISVHATSIKLGKVPTTLTLDLCRVLGYLTADGRLQNGPSIGFCNSDPEKIRLFEESWTRCFPDHSLKKSSDLSRAPTVGSSCKFIKLFLEERCGFKNVLAGEKQIPTALLSAPRSHILAFLEAYLTCDGEMGRTLVTLSSASFLLMRQMSSILTHLGVPNQVSSRPIEIELNHKTKGKRIGQYGWLKIKRKDFELLISETKIYRKGGLPGIDAKPLNQADNIPFLRSIIHRLCDQRRVRKGQKFFWQNDSGKIIPFQPILLDKRGSGRTPHINRALINHEFNPVIDLKVLKKVSTSHYNQITSLLNPNLRFEEVVEVENLNNSCRVYDLSVPSNTQFFGNGILCHNTVIATSAICEIGQKTIIMASQRDWLLQFRETFIGSETMDAMTTAKPRQIKMCKTYEDFMSTDICLATPQQFMNKSGRALLQRIKDFFVVLAWDEVHLSPALETSRVLSQFNTEYRFGLSGTPERKDSLYKIVEDLIGPVIYEASVDRLSPRIELLSSGVAIKPPMGGNAAFASFINRLEHHPQRMKKVVDRVIQAVKEKHMVLLPCLRVKTVQVLIKAINIEAERKLGIEKAIAARFVGGMPKKERSQVIQDARNYKIKVLVGNIKLLSTGLNIPRASMLIEYTLSSNRPNAIQRVARVLTPMDGKPTPVVVFVLDDSKIMRTTRKSEWWGAINPEFKPRLLPDVQKDLFNWFKGGDSHDASDYRNNI